MVEGVEAQEGIATMEEDLLPPHIRAKAAVAAGGEYAWRKEDIEAVLLAACMVGLALIGGQVQFQFPDGTCEAYWLRYSSGPQGPDEPWPTYVERSAQEIREQINHLCATTDFVREAMEWAFIRQKVQTDGVNPLGYLWFVLYFEAAPSERPA
jgi:hypothetical protein